MEAFMYRSHPQTQRVLDIIRGGEIGPVRLIRTSFCYRTTRIDDNIRFRADLAGGALMDVGCYCISFSRLLAGNDPLAVTAAASMHERGIDQGVVATMRFPGGVLASFACAMNIQADNSAHICGEEGYVQIGWPWKPPRSAHFTMARGIPPRQDQRAGSTAPPPPRMPIVICTRWRRTISPPPSSTVRPRA
jgi:D-xylose 1-dehydrogenase (NADP+, D-xylono-1,5-lactone-forming)